MYAWRMLPRRFRRFRQRGTVETVRSSGYLLFMMVISYLERPFYIGHAVLLVARMNKLHPAQTRRCTGTFKWIHFLCLKAWIVCHRHCARMNNLHPHQTRRSTGTVKWIHFLCLKAWIVFHRHCVRMKICTHLGHVGQPKLSNEFASYVLKFR